MPLTRLTLALVLAVGALVGCDDQAIESKLGSADDARLALLDVSERELGDVNSIALLFSTPLEADQNFTAAIVVEPQLSPPVLSNDGRTLHFTGIQPETQYRVKQMSGASLRARNGTTLENEALVRSQAVFMNFDFLTRGVLIVTRSLPPLVSFEVNGAVIMPGSDAGLPVLGVNVPEADINVYRVTSTVSEFFSSYQRIVGASAYLFRNANRADKVTHIHTARINIGTAKNTRNRVMVPLADLGDIKAPGVYFATIAHPGAFEFSSATWFTVSSIGLQVREYKNLVRIIAQDLTTGALLEGVDIRILDENKVWKTGRTDAQGIFDLRAMPAKRGKVIIFATQGNFDLPTQGNELTILRYSAPPFDLSEFQVDAPTHRPIELFLYSPRDIYRPGETLVLSVLKRDAGGDRAAGPIDVEIQNPSGSTVHKFRLKDQAEGYFQFDYTLQPNSPLGLWNAVVSSPESAASKTRFAFKVEDFLPERLRLIFDGGAQPRPSFGPAQNVTVAVKGEYLYGAPASGNRLDAEASINLWVQPFETLKGFRFGNQTADLSRKFTFDQVKLDDNGEALTTVSALEDELDGIQDPAMVRIVYSLYETGGRAVNRARSLLYWPKPSYVGVRPLFKGDRSAAEGNAGFELLRTDARGEAIGQGKAKVELIRVEVQYFWSFTRTRGWHYRTESKTYPVYSDIVSFIGKDPVSIEIPVDWGRYRLEVTDLDADSLTVYPFRAGENWYARWKNAENNIQPDRVTIALDKEAYRPGEEARAKITAPSDGKALVLLEADGVLHSQVVDLRNHMAEVSIPVPADLAQQNVYVSAFVVASTDATDKLQKRSFGVVPLPLDRSDRKLTVALDLPEKWRPEQRVEAVVKVTGELAGEIFLTLSAVDSGALSLTGYKVSDPFDTFYGQRKYGVRITDMYDDVLVPSLINKAQIRWGGDEDLLRGGDQPVTDVQIVSLFSGRVAIKDGLARIPLDLPAFDGELTITAVAFSKSSFGKASQTVTVAAPVVAQIAVPRFLALGDKAELNLDVTNLTGGIGEGTVSFRAEGALAASALESRLQWDDGEKKVFGLVVEATAIGPGKVVAEVDLAGEQVRRQRILGVRAASPAEFHIHSNLLTPGGRIDLPLDALRRFVPQTVRVQLRIGGSPDLRAGEHFAYLYNYSYGCLEQTTSKSRPFSVLPPAEQRTLLGLAVNDDEVNAKVNAALTRYSELQLPNGGFGLWNNRSPEKYWLTVYATENLMDLKSAGYAVSDNMLNRAFKRLQAYILMHDVEEFWWRSNSDHYLGAFRAYAAYVLARAGKVSLGPVLDIAESGLGMTKGPVPGVHAGLAMIMLGDMERGAALVAQNLEVKRGRFRYLGDYGSSIRDRAMAMDAVLRSEGVPAELIEQVLTMLGPLGADLNILSRLSPQEHAVLFKLSMSIAALDLGAAFQGVIEIATQQIDGGYADDNYGLGSTKVTLLTGNGVRTQTVDGVKDGDAVSFVNNGERAIFASLTWSGVAREFQAEVFNGIRVISDSYRIVGSRSELLQAGAALEPGDIILTRVRMVSVEDVADALLVHLLPAGLELENQNLSHSLKLEDVSLIGVPIAQKADILHEEYRDDRYVAALTLRKDREVLVYYLARAVVPGTYVVPPARVESMYTPALNGIGNTIGKLTVGR